MDGCILTEKVIIRLNKSLLHNTATYWLQELYFWTECLSQKLKLFVFVHLQLLSQSGKQMKPMSLTDITVLDQWWRVNPILSIFITK